MVGQQFSQFTNHPFGKELVNRVALLYVLVLCVFAQNVLEQIQLGLVLVILLDGFEVGADDLLDQHQFLLFQLFDILKVLDEFNPEFPLNLGLEIGLVDEPLLLRVDISFALIGFRILLFLVNCHNAVAQFQSLLIVVLEFIYGELDPRFGLHDFVLAYLDIRLLCTRRASTF